MCPSESEITVVCKRGKFVRKFNKIFLFPNGRMRCLDRTLFIRTIERLKKINPSQLDRNKGMRYLCL